MAKNNKVCGIWGKWFSSGKSIRNHMRSHLLTFFIPPKSETNSQAVDNSTDLTLRSIQSDSSLTANPENK